MTAIGNTQPQAVQLGSEILFIISNITDYQTLVEGTAPGAEVHVLDAAQDGLAQIATILDGRYGIDAIHIVSHGSAGSVNLGTVSLNTGNLPDHLANLATIGAALTVDADILLYGCDVAAGSAGEAFINALAQATQADIAASTDTTGATAKGGNWVLEKQVGQIDVIPEAAFNPSQYDGTLISIEFDYEAGVTGLGTKDARQLKSGETLKAVSTDQNLVSGYNSLSPYDGSESLSTDWGTGAETSITFSLVSGKTFDLTSIGLGDINPAELLTFTSIKGTATYTPTIDSGTGIATFNVSGHANAANFQGITSFTITTADNSIYMSFDSIALANITAPGPTVTDANISITSTPTGTSSTYKIGDTVTASWNNTAGGDNQSGITGVTMDFSAFGGGGTVAASDNGSGTWTASYILSSGSIDGTNKNVSVTATSGSGSTTTADTTNLTADNQAPTVTDGRIAISGASGTSGAYKIGDTVTATWNNTAGGDNNSDTISSATANFSAFGGGTAVAASNSGGTWTATYTIVAGAIDGTNKNVSFTATDNAGNTTTTADTTNATLDNVAPTVTDARISISGSTGTGGAYKIGDTVTATWNNTAGGDNNSDTISGVTMDFSQFGGGAAVAASNSGGTWTATYTIIAGAINGTTNRNVSVTATDNAGNTLTTADSTNATVDNVAPTLTNSTLSFSADTGSSSTDFITKTAAQTISGTLSGVTSTGDIVEVSLDNGSTWATTSNTIGQNSWSLAGQTLTASNTLKVRVTDAAGNSGSAASQAYVLDTTAPSITAVSIPNTTMKVSTGVTATITVADDGGSVYTLGSGTIGGFTLGSLTRTNSTTYTAQFTVTEGGTDVAAGSDIPVSLVLNDPAGNSNTAYTTAISQAGDAINAKTPTDIALSNNSVATIGGTNAVVGALSSTDATSSDTFTYSLVAGGGDTNNGLFNISAGNLRATDASALTAGNSYSARVRTTDAAGNTYEEAMTVNAVNNPTVTGVTSSTANNSYNAGGVVSIQVTFSESVTVSGTPQLTLETGGTDRTINYVSGSPGTTLTFSYTVQAGDTNADLDYVATTSLALNSGTINATTGGAAATLTLPAPGATNSLGANKNIIIDTTAPSAPSTPDMTAGTDSGSSNTDNITNDNTPTFTGTAEAGSTVILYDTDGTTSLGSATATGGNWSITASTLSTGAHTLTAKATDAAGNVSVASGGLAITIDTAAPAAPSTPDMTAGTDSGTSNSDNITSDTTPTFTGTAEAGSTVTLYDTDGTTSLGTATADGSGNWSITASTLSAGAHTVTAKATDTAGNVSSASSGLSVTIDATAPTLTNSTLSFSADTGSSSTDFITKTAAQTISGTLSGVTSTGDIVEVSLDNGSTWATTSNTIGQNSWSLAGQTLTASNTLKVRVTDAAGNSGSAASQAYVLDTTAPSITAVSIPNTTMKVGTVVTATITVADDGGSVYTLGSGTIGGFTLGSLTRTNSTTYTAQFTVTEGGTDVAAGSDIPLSLVLTDPAGNSSTAYTTAISQAGDAINAHSPSDIALSNNSVATIGGTNAVVGALSSTDGTSSETFAYSLVAGAGDTNNGLFNINGGNLRANDASGLTAGNTYNVRVRTTDAAGNTYEEAMTVNAVVGPAIASATYDASTGVLTVTGSLMEVLTGADNDIAVNKLTLTGEGGETYTLTTNNVENTSATAFSVTLNATDKAAVNQILNKTGTSSTGGTTFNLAAADDWNANVTTGDTSDATNAVTVSNVAAPTITSATYDAATGGLVLTGTGFLKFSGVTNDIVANKLTFTGEDGATYTLTDTANVEITSGTAATLTLSATDKAAINQIVNKNGTSATGGTTYNIAAAEDWTAGAAAAVVVADLTGNGITVSNVAAPTITSATYDAATGGLVLTGTGFLKLSGVTNDIVANKLTFTGEDGATYTLTDTANVEITSGTAATLTLSATDKAAINQIVNKNGTSATGGTTYNIAAAEDWTAGAAAAVVVADLTGNGITASNVAVPTITSATYDGATGQLVVTGTGFLKLNGATNDIDISKLSIAGDSTGYTLTSSSVEITSGTSFTVTLNATDINALKTRINKDGTSSQGSITYNLAAAEDWAAGAAAGITDVDLTGNGITASNVSTSITSATYDAGTGVLSVTGANLTNGGAVDITKLSVTGQGGASYTLAGTYTVTASSTTAFSVTLDATDKINVNGLLNKTGTSAVDTTTFNLAAAASWMSGAAADATGNGVTVSNVTAPAITSATYDAATGVLVVTGTNLVKANGVTNDITANTFTLTGEGGATYTLTDTANVEITSGTSFSLTLSATDKAAINQILNKDGAVSTGGTSFNLASADDWNTVIANGDISDPTGNGITVSNVTAPTITSATYNAATGALVVTGTGFLKLNGTTNDIDVSKLTLTGEGSATYTLTTSSVEITNGTSFTVTLNATDLAGMNQILNKTGTASTGGATYNLAGAEDWAAGAAAAVVVADLTGNGVTVSNPTTPTITSATYNAVTGVLVLTGTGFLKLSGANNDIVANKLTITGQGGTGAAYTLTDTSNVEITSATAANLTLSTTDKTAVNALINKAGTASNDNTTYNLAAAEDWSAGAAAAVNVADLTGNGITATLNQAPVITSNGGGATASVSVAENSTAVTTLTATDVDAGQSPSYSISGGADAAKFSINSSSGALSFVTAPNFEAPTDSDSNNSYVVAVTVSDGQGGTDLQTITVTVTDVSEGGGGGGSTTLPPTTPVVTVSDPTGTTVVSTNPNGDTTITAPLAGSEITTSTTGSTTVANPGSTLKLKNTGSGTLTVTSIADDATINVTGSGTVVIDPSTLKPGDVLTINNTGTGVVNLSNLPDGVIVRLEGSGPITLNDADGAIASIENRAPALGNGVLGDGNGDGTPDALQSNVASVLFLNSPQAVSNPQNAPSVFVSLVADSNLGKVNASNSLVAALADVKQLDAPTTLPSAITAPIGQIAFESRINQPGASAALSLYVDGSTGVNAYLKQTASGTWVNIASAAFGGQMVSEGGKTRLDFTIEDGGQFDADGIANGVIVDPGIPGIVAGDSDGDGVADIVENLASAIRLSTGTQSVVGDGNGDGLLDSTQSAVASVTLRQTPHPVSQTDIAQETSLTVVAGGTGGKAGSSTAVVLGFEQVDAPSTLPAQMTTPMGQLSFSTSAAEGQAQTISLYVDTSMGINGYWQQNASGVWINLASTAFGGQVVNEGGKTRLDISVTDGSHFDADHSANGVIAMEGAAGYLPLSMVGYAQDTWVSLVGYVPELPANGYLI